MILKHTMKTIVFYSIFLAFNVALSAFSFGGLLFWEVDSATVSGAGIDKWSNASLYYADGISLMKLDNHAASSTLIAEQLDDSASSWSIYVELYNCANMSAGKPQQMFYRDLQDYIAHSINMSNLADIQRWSGGAYTAP